MGIDFGMMDNPIGISEEKLFLGFPFFNQTSQLQFTDGFIDEIFVYSGQQGDSLHRRIGPACFIMGIGEQNPVNPDCGAGQPCPESVFHNLMIELGEVLVLLFLFEIHFIAPGKSLFGG